VKRPGVLGPFAADSVETKNFLATNGGEFSGANTVDGSGPENGDPNDPSYYVWIDQRFKIGPFDTKEARNKYVRDTFFGVDEDEAFDQWIYNDEA
jgi:hypothetical protein